MNRFSLPLCLAVLSLAACSKGEPTSDKGEGSHVQGPKAAATTAGGAQVADFPITVDLPPGAVANDALGAPGFHSDDDRIMVLIKKTADSAPKSMEAAKKATEEILFKKWVKTDKTADGWVLTWIAAGMDMSGKEYDAHAFQVIKKVGGEIWDCSGAVKQAAHVDANLKLCSSMKPKL